MARKIKVAWSGEGLLWRNLAILDDSFGDWILVLTDAFDVDGRETVNDRVARVTRTLAPGFAIERIKKLDAECHARFLADSEPSRVDESNVDHGGYGGEDEQVTEWAWIERVALRAQLVEALFRAAQHEGGDGHADPTCTNPGCCLPLARLADRCGIRLGSQDGESFFGYLPRHAEDITSAMRDAMMILSDFHEFRSLARQDIFDGYLEVPSAVGAIIHSDHFRGLKERMNKGEDLLDWYNREICHALVEIAFPDDFLEKTSVPFNPDSPNRRNHDLFVRLLEDADYEVPELTDWMKSGMYPDFQTEIFRMAWDPMSPYMLDVSSESEVDGLRGLEMYMHTLQTLPASFGYAERSNGYNTFMCFIVRERSVFVSQQTMGRSTWNAATRAYNTHIAPLLESTFGEVMVVFSDFRQDAYIVSAIEESWDEYAPLSRVLQPLPAGFGLVGVWCGYDENRYTPRPLDDIIRADHSQHITAAARYLKECLAAAEFPD